jgi:hypothetical protein
MIPVAWPGILADLGPLRFILSPFTFLLPVQPLGIEIWLVLKLAYLERLASLVKDLWMYMHGFSETGPFNARKTTLDARLE